MKKIILVVLVMVMFLAVGKANVEGAWVLCERGYSFDSAIIIEWG